MGYLNFISLAVELAIICGGIYLTWLMWHTQRDIKRVLTRLNALPEPILQDLKRRRKKHEVKYMFNGELLTKEELRLRDQGNAQ